MLSGQAKEASPGEGEFRSATHFNAATNLSERVPGNQNIVQIKTTWLEFLSGQRFQHTIQAAERHRMWWARIGGGEFTKHKVGDLGYRASKNVTKCFSTSDIEKVRKLKDAESTTYLVVRGLQTMRKPMQFPFPSDEKFPEEQKQRDIDYVTSLAKGKRRENPPEYARKAKNEISKKRKAMDRLFRDIDYCMAGIACMLGCEIRPRFESDDGILAKHLITDPSEQQSSDLDNLDVPLRFHQSAVERKLPDPNVVQSNELSPCAFRLYYCVKNIRRMPIYLIRVKELIEEHLCPYESDEKKTRIIEVLEKPNKFSRRPPQPSDGYSDSEKSDRVLFNKGTKGKPDWIMLYDHERVRALDKEGEEALYELRNAIRRARRDAIRIHLNQTDFVVVDNLRAMVSRREYFPTRLRDVMWVWLSLPRSRRTERLASGTGLTRLRWGLFRPHRWLRTYYLFRDEKAEQARVIPVQEAVKNAVMNAAVSLGLRARIAH